MKRFETVTLFHNGYIVGLHENVSEAIEHINIILKSRRKLRPKKILELTLVNKTTMIYELKNKRKELFYIESD